VATTAEPQIPLPAQRSLARTGLSLTIAGWQSLSDDLRLWLVALGTERAVDVDSVRDAVKGANPACQAIEAAAEPSSEHVPVELSQALGPAAPLSNAVWAALSPLDRYALEVALVGGAKSAREAYRDIVGHTAVSTHLGAAGGARMVDVSEKPETRRLAVSESAVTMSAAAYERLCSADVAKGDVLGVARVAGIMGAKRTADLIPLCHPVALSKVTVDLELDDASRTVRIVATAEAVGRTGVEMESLVAASAAALTIYDMLKSLDRAMILGPTRLLKKSGGRTGDFTR
jgi:cyclic pyranopterin phosphate synthase